MSPAYLVASILAIGWNVVIAALVVFSNTDPFGEEVDSDREMSHFLRSVRAEVGTLEYNAQSGRVQGLDDGTVATNQVRRDIEKTSCEVEVDVPYAGASVPVTTDEGNEQRRCSVCMN
jgi:hypothetical protein